MTYPANWHPVTQRAEQLMQRLQVFRTGRRVRFTMLLSHVTHGLEYFSPGKDEDLQRYFAASQFQYLPPDQMKSADVVILSAHGSDISGPIWNVRQDLGRDTLARSTNQYLH